MAKKKTNNLSKIFTENFWVIWFLVVITIILVFVSHQDALANFVWQKYHWPKTALLINRSDADLAIYIGNYYFNGVVGNNEYNPDISQRAYKKAISINPKILWGHYQLARIYFVKGNFDKAIEEINKELEYNPENLRSLYVRGLIFGYRGNLNNAEEDFRRFTQWSPKEWAGYNDLAWILAKQGKYKEAEKIIKEAMKEVFAADVNSWLWNALGVAQLNLKKYAEAKISFEKALALAQKLTESDWHHSYPGNDPATSGEGLSAFLKAINENLKRAKEGSIDKIKIEQ